MVPPGYLDTHVSTYTRTHTQTTIKPWRAQAYNQRIRRERGFGRAVRLIGPGESCRASGPSLPDPRWRKNEISRLLTSRLLT